jgi:hypothetical protein
MAKKRQGIRCSYLYIDWKSIGDSVVEVVVIIETNRPFGVSPRMEKKLFFAHYSSITVRGVGVLRSSSFGSQEFFVDATSR